jgi:hypothetical protein
MVFPAVTRPQPGPSPGVAPSTPHAATPSPRLRAVEPRGEAYARLESCLAEVRLLELGLTPPAGETWSARYQTLGAARNAELATFWQRQLALAMVSTALAIAVVALAATGAVPPAVLSAANGLGLGVVAAWAFAARAGAERLAHWDARLDALEAEAALSELPLPELTPTTRPAATRGTSLLIAVFGLFWIAATLAVVFAPALVLPRLA